MADKEDLHNDRTLFNHNNSEQHTPKILGLDENVVRRISAQKKEPEWMLQLRLQALKRYQKTNMPSWGPSLKKLDLQNIRYYIQPKAKKNQTNWDDVPKDIRKTFDKLGIPEAEKKNLAGTGAQYESEVIYHKLKEELTAQGVLFLDMDVAVQEHEELVRAHFSRCIPLSDHKFSMLHYAVWSGGTFIYIPQGVHLKQPLQAYFRMNAKRAGQFEHTIIIIEEGASAEYIEGCSAPQHNDSSIHAGCVEVFIRKKRKTQIQFSRELEHKHLQPQHKKSHY